MARVCEITGKRTITGHSRRHRRGKAGGVSGAWSRKAQATKRTWKPNLTTVRVLIDGYPTKLKMSMKAYKRLRNYGRLGNVTLPISEREAVA